MKKNIILLFLFLGSFLLAAQPVDYFQQDVAYQINVELFPQTKMLKGTQHFTYTNHSKTALDFIWFHLYPNAFKDETTPFAKQQVREKKTFYSLSDSSMRGWMNADFYIDGKKLTTELKADAIDEIKVWLPKPLQSGESLTMEIPFEVKLPYIFSRIGFAGNFFSITQWYPKVVVFDKYGWHPDSYLDSGEFYGEYGTFDVSFTLPKNYVMDATGLIENNPEEQQFMDSLVVEYKNYLTLSDSDRVAYRLSLPGKRKELLDYNHKKTVRYLADHVQDFAMFCSEDASVDKKVSGDGVVSYVLIQPMNLDGWKNAATYALETVASYGKLVGKYPHPKASVVDGALSAGGGMEYPMITVISAPDFPGGHLLEDVIVHEVGHNWFQGILGSNERANAWMDEGINSYYESLTLENKYGFDKSFLSDPDSIPIPFVKNLIRPIGVREYFKVALDIPTWTGIDLPNNLRAEEYDLGGNTSILYQKTAFTMYSLKWYLGEERFNNMMQTYFEKWKFKHPYPEDFYNNAKATTGEDLTWFFDQYMNSVKNNDFVIQSVDEKKTNNGYETTIKVKNKGDMMMPAPVYLTTVNSEEFSARWDPKVSDVVTISHKNKLEKVGVNTKMEVLESDYKNNWDSYQFKVSPFFGIPSFFEHNYYYIPIVGFEPNKDKLQLGVGFYSATLLGGPGTSYTGFYYAPNSNVLGFRHHYRYRMPRLFSNYSDMGWNVLDQEGFSKQELYFNVNYLSLFGQNATAEIGIGHYNNYDQAYMNPLVYQLGQYSTVDFLLKGTIQDQKNLLSGVFALSKGMKVLGGTFDFSKIEAKAGYIYKLKNNDKLDARLYFGYTSGGAPLQEYIFAGSNTDARRNTLLLGRAGSFSLLDHLYSGGGMGMVGYAVGKTYYFDKSGLSTRLTYTNFYSGLNAFVDAGSLASKTLDLFSNKWFYDAGIGYNYDLFAIYVPFYVSNPAPSDKEFNFRFVAEFRVLDFIKQFIR